jgi:outer membrane protein OmpA-like peptidoglycan-associated protein
MKFTVVPKFAVFAALLAFSYGCASRGYVRHQVKDSSDQLSAKIDSKTEANEKHIQTVASNVSELSDQLGETSRLTKENSNQIKDNTSQIKDTNTQLASAKDEIRSADAKAAGAISASDANKAAIGETGKRVDGLSNQFASRNNLGIASEDAVLFAFNSAKLQKEYEPVLDGIAQKLKQDPDAVIVLEGRTDSTGDADYNIRLGQQRLDAVMRYLVVHSDVAVQRIYQISLGKDKPVGDNKTKEGREQNRATVVRVLSPKAAGAAVATN